MINRTVAPVLLLALASSCRAVFVPATDPSIVYSGRWAAFGTEMHASSPGQRFRFSASVEAASASSSVRLLVRRNADDFAPAPALAVRVDGGAWQRYDVTEKGETVIPVVQGAAGNHHVEAMVIAQWGGDFWGNTSGRFMLRGLDVDGTIGPGPMSGGSMLSPRGTVVVVGDSISCGHLLLSAAVAPGGNGQSDASRCGPALMGEWMGREVVNVSVPGIGLVKPYAGATAGVFVKNVFRGRPWTPGHDVEAVFVNLGTNDWLEAAEDVRAALEDLLVSLRGLFPTARIHVLRPFNGTHAGALEDAVTTRKRAGDARVAWVDTQGWLERERDTTDTLHPNGRGSMRYAWQLSTILASLTGEALPGDFNGDRQVTIADAGRALQGAGGLVPVGGTMETAVWTARLADALNP